MMTKIFVSAILSLALTSLSENLSWARPVDGDNEIEVAAGFFHAQGSSNGAFSADLKYGYFLTPGWELGLRQALNYNFIDGGRDFWTATTTPFVHYNFNFGRFVPYLGGSIGLVYNDQKVTGAAGPNAGLKIFFDDQTYLSVGYRYEFYFSSLRSFDNNTNHGNHTANIGIGFEWGGNRETKKP
jgi:hypothetical protein